MKIFRNGKTRFSMLLMVTGGFMDIYSYLGRGKVFATGQTGNYCLLSIRLLEGDWYGVGHYLIPIAAFWLGILLIRHLHHTYFLQNETRWRITMLLINCVLFFLLGLFAEVLSNSVANALISFGAAMQFGCFRTTEDGLPYAPVFCTGNMRSCADALYDAVFLQDSKAALKFFEYLQLLIAFFIGCLLGNLCIGQMGLQAIAVIAVLYLILLFQLVFAHRSQKQPMQRVGK